jgi:hypothetical protein
MNEQVIDDLYNRAVSLGYKKDRNSYVKLIHSNPSVFNDSYSYVKSKGYKKSTDDFSSLIGLTPKKKVPTQVSKPSVGSSGTTETPQKQSSGSSKGDGIYKYQGNLKANYKKENGQWYIDPTGGTKFQPLKQGDVAKRVKVLESQANYDADLTAYNMPNKAQYKPLLLPDNIEGAQAINAKETEKYKDLSKAKVFTGFPTKEENKYRVVDGLWQRSVPNEKGEYSDWSTVKSESSIKALNGQFKQNVSLDVAKTLEEYSKIGFKDINSDLIGGDEADAVPMLNNKYKSLGFSFREGLGDQMIVTSSIDGVPELVIDMDSWDSAKDANNAARLRAYLAENSLTPERKKELAFEKQATSILSKGLYNEPDQIQRNAGGTLQSPIMNVPKIDQGFVTEFQQAEKQVKLRNLEKETGLNMDEIQAKKARKSTIYGSEKVMSGDFTAKAISAQNKVNKVYVDNEIKDISLRDKYTQRLITQYEDEKADFEANYDNYSQEERAIKESQLKEKATELKQSYDQTKKDADKVGYLIQSQAASTIASKLVKEKTGTVAGSIGRSLTDAIIDSSLGISQALGNNVTTQERQRAKDDLAALFTHTTSEFSASEDRSLLTKTVQSLVQMTPAIAAGIATGGSTAGAAYFWGMSYSNSYDSMDGLDIPEADKRTMSAVIATATAALESYGLEKITSSKAASGFIAKRVARLLSGLPKGATMEMMNTAIYADMKKVVADKLIKVAGKGIIEGGVEVSQSAAETGIKELYDLTRDKEVFTEDWGTFGKNALDEFLIGSFAGSTVNAMSNLGTTVQQLRDPENFGLAKEIATDKDLQDLFKNDLKSKIIQGEMSIPEAKAKLRAVGEFKALLGKVPSNMLETNQQEAMKLIEEKQKLQSEIEGKEPSLVEDKKQRIVDIDNEMKQLVEDDAKGEIRITAKGLDQVPTEFRDRARNIGTLKKGLFGKTQDVYAYTVTRDEYTKLKGNAVQERSTEEVLPREQEQAGETGGQREGMGQSLEGQEVTKKSAQKVRDVIGSRVSLTGFGGVTFEKPLIGEIYVGGQQVIFEESASGKFYELGNVNEISDSNFKDLGIDTKTIEGDIAQSSVVPTENGMLQYNGEEFNVDGKIKMKNNEVDRVILTSPDGARTVTLRGQEAMDAAYLITLNKIQSPEQEAMINDLLEQDEEFKRETENIKFTEVEDVAEEKAVTDTEQTIGETAGEVESEEDQRARLEELLASKPKFQRESNPLNTNFDKPLINSLITNLRSKGEEETIAVLEAIRDGKPYDVGFFELSEVVDSIIENGLTFGNVVGILKSTSDFYSDLTTKEIISKLSNIGDPNIGRIAKETIKFQKTEPIAPEDIESIRKEIESIDSEVVSAEIPSDLTTKNKTNIKSLASRFRGKLKSVFKGGIIKNIRDFNGIPMTFSISDQLGSGEYINPVTGNKFLLNGGLGFNLTDGNENFAWANTEKGEAEQMLNRAKSTYEKNKDLFDKLWSEGKLPNGLVPVAIVKMGQDSVLTNEALFRVAADTFRSKLPLENRVNALNKLLEISSSNIDRISKISKEKRSVADKALIKASQSLYNFVNNNNFNSIDELFDNINKLNPITARGLVSNLSFVGGVELISTKKPGNPSKEVAKALVDGLDKSYNKFISAQFINDMIKEESTSTIPDQHIISIVGVDVVNSSIEKPNHRNYPYGVKGKLIGILESPVHVADVFPGFYARTFAMLKPNKAGNLPTMKQSVGQAVAVSGSIVNMKSLVGARLTSNMTDIQKLLAKLKLAFPSVTISDTVEEFNKALEDPSVKAFTRDGDVIYGFTKGNKVFLNPEIATENTAIHEFAHIWMGFLRENNSKLLQKGFDLAKKSELYKRKLAENNNDPDLAAEETLAELIASKGEAIFLAAKDASNFKDWLNAMYTYIKTKIPGFKNLTPKQFENLTLEEFVDNSLNSLLSGKEVTQKEVKSLKAMFSKVNMTAEEIIRVGRANRIADAVIERYLNDNGYTGYEEFLGKIKPTPKPRTELKDLENKIRLYARAKRETKQDIMSVIKNISTAIKGMVTDGPMKRMQFRYVMTKLARVNFNKQESVDNFIKYVFDKMMNAEYIQKVNQANKINKTIKRSSKVPAEVSELIKNFTKIKPALVDNIDAHLAIAQEIKDSLSKYRRTEDGIEFRRNINIASISKYIENNKENVSEPIEKTLNDTYEKVFGIGSSEGKSDEEMSTELAEAGVKKVNELRDAAKEELAMLKEEIENDPDAPDIVKRAVNVNMDFITFENAVDIINGVTMYTDNDVVSGLTKLVENYEGKKAVKESKIRFSNLRGIFGGKSSRGYNKAFAYNNMIISKKQNKQGQADEFKKQSKLNQVEEGYNRGDIETAKKQKAYTEKFKSIKNFLDATNKAERALFAFVQRNVLDENKKASEFLRRKELVLDSINELRKDKTKKSYLMADLTEKTAKKLGILNEDGTVNKAITIDEIRRNTEAYNVSAVKWMQAMHAEKFGEFVDHVLGFHNSLLAKEDFYTPDRLSIINPNINNKDEIVFESDFGRFTGMVLKKAGSFMEATRPSALKNRFINLDFEENNFGSHKAMLHDLYTSAAKEFHNAYRSSKDAFAEVMGTKTVKIGNVKEKVSPDAELYNEAYNVYIQAKENKTKPDTETERKVKVFLRGLGTITSAAALGSVKNIAAQTIPIYTDAIISAHGPLGILDEGNWIEIIYDSFDKKVMKLIESADSQVATRGSDVFRFNEKVEKQVVERTRAAKIAGKVVSVPVITSEVIMKLTNQYGDKLSAVGVWMANYRKYCKDNNIEIDYDNLNREAARYAENKTKIQILPSDSAERGTLGASNSVAASAMRQIFFPYSSFSINAKNRIYRDVLNFVNSSWTTKEGFQLKKESMNDLIAAGTGLVMFQGINYYWRVLVGQLIVSAFLDDEDEEELIKKIKQASMKIAAGQGINDVLSPIPILDIAITMGANKLISMGNLFGATEEGWQVELEELRKKKIKNENRNLTEEDEIKAKANYFDDNAFQLFTKDEISYWEQFGGLGILADKAIDMYDMTKSAFTGKYISEYKGNKTEKTLTKEGKEKVEALSYLKSIALVLPSADLINITDKTYKMIGKNYTLTDEQVKTTDEVKEWADRIGYEFDKYAQQAVKIQGSANKVEESIRKMYNMSDKEKKEYIKSLKD